MISAPCQLLPNMLRGLYVPREQRRVGTDGAGLRLCDSSSYDIQTGGERTRTSGRQLILSRPISLQE